MGNYGRRKHPRKIGSDVLSHGYHQTKLPRLNNQKISRADAKEYLIPVLKEIGKAVFPAAAPIIEAAYQLYRHYDAIKEGTTALSKGDYEGAAKVAAKEVAKEAVGAYVSEKLTPTVNTCAETASTVFSNNIKVDNQENDLAEKVVEGSIKGCSEAIEDKSVDKLIQKVVPK